MTHRWRLALLALVSLLSALAMLTPRLLGFHTLPLPRGPVPNLDTEQWSAALTTAVRPEGVDYEALREGRDHLLRFVKALSVHGPETTPETFPTQPEKLAFYLNAYNAMVLYGVLVHAPARSVQDVRGFFNIRPGFGFFYAMGFELDGKRTNLYDLENDVIRGFGDPRIHAALNCASASCPPLHSEPFSGANLDATLDMLCRRWVARDDHVRIEDDALLISEIFDWYAEDFQEAGGAPQWIRSYLQGAKKTEFESALAAGRPVRFMPYDWSLNTAQTSTLAGR